MSNPKKSDKFSTAFESMDNDNRTPKAAGLSKEEAIVFEKKECSKALQASLLKEDVSEDHSYGVIRMHIDLLLSAVTTVNVMYA